MPLTPAEVHNVAFKKPPIGKRGYDEEEVDAFLDIVEVELSRLIEENNDLRATGGTATSGDDASGEELADVRAENGRLQQRIGELEQALTEGDSGAQQQVVALQQKLAETEQQLAENRKQLDAAQEQLRSAPAGGSGDAAGLAPAEHHAQAVQMLALAQQTADQHLAASKAEAERLIEDARAQADSTVAEATARTTKQISDAELKAKQLDDESTARATQTVQEAEQRAATITGQLEGRKEALERRVEELRTFEREYRTRLKSYLESQLRDLDASGNAEPVAANPEYADAQKG